MALLNLKTFLNVSKKLGGLRYARLENYHVFFTNYYVYFVSLNYIGVVEERYFEELYRNATQSNSAISGLERIETDYKHGKRSYLVDYNELSKTRLYSNNVTDEFICIAPVKKQQNIITYLSSLSVDYFS